MKKIILIINVFALIALSLVLFLIPSSFTSSFFISYALLVIITLLSLLEILLSQKTEVTKYGMYYLIEGSILIQFVISLIFKFVSNDYTWLAIILGTVNILCCIGIYILNHYSIKHIDNLEKNRKEKRNNLKELVIELEMLSFSFENKEKEEITKLIKKIEYSDPFGIDKTQEMEEEIHKKVLDLQNQENKLEAINEIDLLVTKRNKTLKSYK